MPSAEFDKAAEDVKNVAQKPTNDELLELYSLFKQTTVGDCNTDKPGMFSFEAKAKWEAWNKQKGTSQADAEAAYVAKANEIISKYGMK